MHTFKRTPWQKTVWDDTHRYKVINCGRRAGKSTLAAYKMLHFAANKNKAIVWYIAPTYKQAKQIMHSMLQEIIPGEAIKKSNETELKFELINGARIELKGADNPDSLRGVRIDLAIFDEVAFFDKWEDSWKVIRPTLMDSKADVMFISTPNGFNHFKELSETDKEDWHYYHFTTYDNPFIPPEEIEASKLEMGEDAFAQEIMGEFRKMSGLIYKEFSRETHMVQVPDITGWTRARAIDFGYGHKTCCVWFAINSDGSQIYAYDGFYQSGMTLDQIADAVKIKDGQHMITTAVGDSAQPLNIAELNNRGVGFQPVEKGPDSVKMGIQKVATLLKVRADTGRPSLMFAKHLDWIANEFERYRWMENKAQGMVKEVPLKNEDDAMDAIRYFVMSYQKPITESQISSLPQFQAVWDEELGL
jgi:PBSX family phage terminase large subunit